MATQIGAKPSRTTAVTTIYPNGPVLLESEGSLLEIARVITLVLQTEGSLSVVRPEWIGEHVIVLPPTHR